MDNNQKELTILLPVHNGMPYLKEAVDSILNQTYKNFQLIIIDNASTDGTKDYIKSLNDERIEHSYLEQKGLVNALNFGLSKIDTPFTARMDADDICHPERLEKQLEFLRQNPEIDILGTCGKYFGKKKERFININLPVKHEEIVTTMLNSRHAIIHASIMFRTKNLSGELYDERYFPCEDFEWFLRLGKKCRFANLPERLYQFRIAKGSVIAVNIKDAIAKYYVISDKYSAKYGFRKNGNKLFQKADLIGITIYRQGLDYYLNRNTFIGMFLFFIAAIFSPGRVLRQLMRRKSV